MEKLSSALWGEGRAETAPRYACPRHHQITLTFLHRDGWLLLSQSQEDEEEHQWDEDLKSQHPLQMTQSRGIMTARDRTSIRERHEQDEGP